MLCIWCLPVISLTRFGMSSVSLLITCSALRRQAYIPAPESLLSCYSTQCTTSQYARLIHACSHCADQHKATRVLLGSGVVTSKAMCGVKVLSANNMLAGARFPSLLSQASNQPQQPTHFTGCMYTEGKGKHRQNLSVEGAKLC